MRKNTQAASAVAGSIRWSLLVVVAVLLALLAIVGGFLLGKGVTGSQTPRDAASDAVVSAYPENSAAKSAEKAATAKEQGGFVAPGGVELQDKAAERVAPARSAQAPAATAAASDAVEPPAPAQEAASR